MKKQVYKQFPATLISILLLIFVALPAYGQVAARYSDYVKTNDDTRLISLATEIHPAIYLKGNTDMKSFGNGDAVVLHTDAASIPMLYAENAAFGKVELIKITINTAADEAAMLDLLKAASFKSLKYVLCIYQYDSCGGNKDTCLPTKTDKLCKAPAESNVKVLYQLSIPE